MLKSFVSVPWAEPEADANPVPDVTPLAMGQACNRCLQAVRPTDTKQEACQESVGIGLAVV
jgi:hypothetical protein